MQPFDIGSQTVGSDHPTFIIAEAGSNHNGDLEMAKELIEVAAAAGVDAVKFQTFRTDRMYAEQPSDSGDELVDQFQSLEMPYDWIPKLHEHCEAHGVQFLSTPFDRRSAEELAPYVPAFKVASLSMSHHRFLEVLAEMDKPLLVSTGAHTLEEVSGAVSTLEERGVSDLALLQCTTAYPTPLEDANVRVVETLREEFECHAGFSDHTTHPVAAPSSAVALGAVIVEKHFTLDSSLPGPDHEFALEPDELEAMIDGIRRTERALGSSEKRILDVEQDLKENARRAIHAAEPLESGTELSEENVVVRRPGERERGLDPDALDELVGRTVSVRLDAGEGITWEKLKD